MAAPAIANKVDQISVVSVQSNKTTLKLSTEYGDICLKFLPDHAPKTCAYISNTVQKGFYSNASFYRSDFVIQCGLHGSGIKPPSNLSVNETDLYVKMSNTRGTAAIAHWDKPDCGNTEFFINLQTNAHLDSVYGGYCVFAMVEANDKNSFAVVDKIADEIANQKKNRIQMKASIV